ncbi:MAG: hypothetical protein KAS87_03375, partial [Candidatus Omnitrophica bacterium]|nr:hypothetical protein [Candidatus Omnitrophota bacterium]
NNLMAKKSKISKQKISDDLKDLVVARLDVLPSDKKISIGSNGEFTKEELIERVKKGDEIGQKVVELEITFLKALKEGILLEEALA